MTKGRFEEGKIEVQTLELTAPEQAHFEMRTKLLLSDPVRHEKQVKQL